MSGPFDTFARRHTAFEELQRLCDPFDARQLLHDLPDAQMQRTKELRALSAFSVINETFAKFGRLTNEPRIALENALNFIHATPFLRHLQQPRPVTQYLAQLELFDEDYQRLVRELGPRMENRQYDELIYGYLTSLFSFPEFRDARPELAARDRALDGMFSTRAAALVEKQFTSEIKHRDEFIPRVRRLAKQERLVGMLRAAGSESTPLRKLRAFGHALGACWAFFVSGLPPTFEYGADEITPSKVAFVIVAQVPYLASNVAYLKEFCQDRKFDGRCAELATLVLLSLPILSAAADVLNTKRAES
jgi:hypothetical protein